MFTRNYFLVLLLVASAIEIRAKTILDTVTCTSVGENLCEVPVYDPDLPITISGVAAKDIVEIRLNGTTKSMKLTSNICFAFPNLLKIKAIGIDLKAVAADAFKNCLKLTAVYLGDNHISTLNNSLFESNHELERIELYNYTLKTFDTNILNHSPKLHLLFLSDNGMEEFLLNDVSTQLNELWKIELQNNKLKSLDLLDMKKKFPKIRVLVMCIRDVDNVEKLTADLPGRPFLSLNDFDSCE